MKDQSQKAGDESIQVQVSGGIVVNNQGLTFAEARAIAEGVFRDNALELQELARVVALQRANEMTERFLQELQKHAPERLESFRDPDFQYALAHAQIACSRSGSKKLEDVLVESLVERAASNKRDVLQIVLTESMSTAAKLTDDQLDLLALVFLVRYARKATLKRPEDVRLWIENSIMPFAGSLPPSQVALQHLDYSGCGSTQISSIRFSEVFRQTYGGCFAKGFDGDAKSTYMSDHGLPEEAFWPHWADPSQWQFVGQSGTHFEELAVANGISPEVAARAKNTFEQHVPSGDDIVGSLASSIDGLSQLVSAWDRTLSHFTLSSVGLGIAIASVRRAVPGLSLSFDTWIR